MQQVAVRRSGALDRRRRGCRLRARRLALGRARLAFVEVHRGLPPVGTVPATFVAFTTATPTTTTAPPPATPAATSTAATLTAAALSTLVVVRAGALRTLLRDLGRARLLVLLVGAMTALLAMAATAALLGTMTTALLLAMTTATSLLVTMAAAPLLMRSGGTIADVALRRLMTLATAPLLLGTALVGGGLFRGEFHGESFSEGHFTFAALWGA